MLCQRLGPFFYLCMRCAYQGKLHMDTNATGHKGWWPCEVGKELVTEVLQPCCCGNSLLELFLHAWEFHGTR